MINPKDVSVVVQGAIDKENTPKCLKSIRKYLPDAEIILSTWEGSDVSNLVYDVLVLNKDPGAVCCSIDGKTLNNCNREIYSSFAGIKLSSRKYILKIRSDLILKSNTILKIKLNKYKRNSKFSFFKERIIVPSIYSRYFTYKKNTETRTPLLFHPSDWLYFGLKEDLYSLFNIPLVEEPYFSQYFKNRDNSRNGYIDTHPDRLWCFSPEAYILTAYLKKFHGINIKDKLDITDKNIIISRNILINNFYMSDQTQLSIEMPKYSIYQPLMPKVDREGLYSNYFWQKEYKKLIDKKYKIIFTYCEFLNIIIDFLKLKRRKR